MEPFPLEPVKRLSRDIAAASFTLGTDEARFLADAYYMIQDSRIRANNQDKALQKSEEPHDVITWLRQQDEVLEQQIKRALDKYTDAHPMGIWAKSIIGIGPVISAGLISNIDIDRAPTAGHLWSYCGIEKGQQRKAGQKIAYNPAMKRLCWVMGECFVKVKGHEDDVYGKLYERRKAFEIAKNIAGDYKEEAARQLENKKYSKETEAYKHYITGKLPPGHIHARSKRWAVKIFMSHLQCVWWWETRGALPPKAYAFEYRMKEVNEAHKTTPQHAHFIMPPNISIPLQQALVKMYGVPDKYLK